MIKGVLIALIVFGLIAIIHFISLRVIQFDEEKKSRIRKIFWYVYGVLFIIIGLINMIEKEKFLFFSFFQSCCGLLFLILNYLGEIETKQE